LFLMTSFSPDRCSIMPSLLKRRYKLLSPVLVGSGGTFSLDRALPGTAQIEDWGLLFPSACPYAILRYVAEVHASCRPDPSRLQGFSLPDDYLISIGRKIHHVGMKRSGFFSLKGKLEAFGILVS